MLKALDEIDKSISKKVHHFDLGTIGSYIIFAFAWMYNKPPQMLIWLTYTYFMTFDKLVVMKLLIFQIVGVTITLFLKKTIARERPFTAKEGEDPFSDGKSSHLRKKESNKSMPSGDSCQAAIFAAFARINLGQNFWPIVMLLAMYGRVYYRCHFVGDTIVGATIGYLLVTLLNDYIFLIVEIGFMILEWYE